MAKTSKIDIKDLVPDDKNFNKGSEYGNSLIEKSFSKFGSGRSILIDKHNKIIAGNKSKEFWEWVRKISKTNKIYISEYTAPEDFKPILEFTQKSTLQGGGQQHNSQPNECLFVPINQEKYTL